MKKFSITIIFATLLFSMTSWGKYDTRTFSWSHKIMSPEDESQLVELFNHIINDKVIQFPKRYVDKFYSIDISYSVDHDSDETPTYYCIPKKKKKPSSFFTGSLTYRGPHKEGQKIRLKSFYTESEQDCLSLKKKLGKIAWQSVEINKTYDRNNYFDNNSHYHYTEVVPQIVFECDKNKLKSMFMIDYFEY